MLAQPFEHMIERMTAVAANAVSDRSVPGRRRTVASRRRVESTGWPEFAPPVAQSAGPLGALQAADREIARQSALRARAVADFAAIRPASTDRQQGDAGAMSAERWAARPEVLRGVSEWAAQEVAVALSLTTEAAESLLQRSITLVHRLPGTLAALEAGALHPGHLWPMLDKVAPIDDDGVRAEVEASLLRWAAGRVTTPAQLGATARREVLRRDARAAARRLERAIAQRGVTWRPDAADGMGTVTALLTLPESRVLVEALGAYADALEDDDDAPPRTRGQKMADCLMDLVLRPAESDRPPVQVQVNLVAPVATALGSDESGELDGHPIPAEMVRALLRALSGTALPEAAPGEAALPDASLAGPALPAPAPGDAALPDASARGPLEATGSPGREAYDVDADRDLVEAGASEPGGLGPDGPELAWHAREEADFSEWSDEFTRRVLAGELADPDPMTADALAAWAADAERRILADQLEDPDPFAEGPLVTGESPPDVLVDASPLDHRLLSRDRSPGSADGSTRGSPRQSRSRSADGWWAQADRAVEDAGDALRRAETSLARARRMVRTACAADADDEAAWRRGPAGRLTDAGDVLTALGIADEEQRNLLAELERTAGGGLADRPRIAVTDAVSGALVALTDLPELRRAGTCGRASCRRGPEGCNHDLTGRPGLGPPGATDGYRPGARLDRWVRARDRRCRFPGCRRRVPRGGELDHTRPHPEGPTSAGNLVGFCTGHHRGKHQAPGWRYELAADGTLTVTTPTDLIATTLPPPY